MTDPRETLARIRKQADAATPGPWGAYGNVIDALEKVLELHQPVTDGMGFTEDGYGGISPACSSCGTSDEYAVPYPCPTVTAITTALEATK